MSDKLTTARCRLMMREPWYGQFALRMSWIPSDMPWLEEERRTMGVRVMSSGNVECIFYPPFVERLSLPEIFAVVQHEIQHIVRLHCLRRHDRHPEAWNVAADMTVNGTKDSPRIGYKDTSNGSGALIIPDKDKLVWIPKDWPSDATADYFYDRLMKDAITINVYGTVLDDHSVWQQSDASPDEARQIVKSLVDQATASARGHVPGDLSEAIQKLGKPIVRWRELLKQYLGRYVGNKRDTYSRRNRRNDSFGVPGISHHSAANINVIVDTSGSISTDDLQQFFGEIEAISHRAKTMVLQWDHGFQSYTKYRRGDWKSFKVKGRGGTDMAAPMRWLKENMKVADVQIMLTDGMCNYLPKKEVNFPAITVLTQPLPTGQKNGYYAAIPEYGHVLSLK